MALWRFTTTSPEQTRRAAELLGRLAVNGTVVLLNGELGAGKTCFAQGVAGGLQVPGEQPVTSPTFVIMSQYSGRLPLYHFDLYRLAGPEDLETVGAEELLGRDGVCLVEWPAQCDLQLPALSIDFEVVTTGSRTLEVHTDDPFHERLLELWREAWQALEEGAD